MRTQLAARRRLGTDLSTNTTDHLLRDVELLREHLGIGRWLVQGGSWGSTLALAYAERHPDRVSEVILAAVTMTRPSDIDWLYHGVGQYFPEAWARFREGVPEVEQDGDLVAAYYRLLQHPDAEVRHRAAQDWCDWEGSVVAPSPDAPPNRRYKDPRFRMGFARIVTHYFHHNAWLEDGVLLSEAGRLAGIPAILVHGRFDLGSPLIVAYELHRAWPDSELVVVGSGHSFGAPPMTEALLDATQRFATHA